MSEKFRAMMIVEEDGQSRAEFRSLSLGDLPDYDVLVEVAYSTLNYKDGLAVTGKSRIARRMPMVAGIDLSGTVVESRVPEWKTGDKVIANGFGMSETEWGGYGRYARLKSEWLVSLPEDAFSLEDAMAIGTAGYTAALCVDALEDWGVIGSRKGEVVVTGAAGGVGSVAVSLLANKGYAVVASTGRPETHDYLKSLGASGFIDRANLSAKAGPLQKERWLGGVDTVGSTTLANVLAQAVYGGAITACGLAGGMDLPASVAPHILRSVTLIGVDSVMASQEKRKRAWRTLSDHLDRSALRSIARTEPMSALPKLAEDIVAGRIQGRIVLDVAG